METYILRKATQADQSTIRSLVIKGGINPTGLNWERFTVAESSTGEVIGCVQLKPHRDGSLELASLAVREDWRGRGVARALMEALIDGLDSELYLMCRSGLGPLYEKFGFVALEEDEMPPYFRRVSKLVSIVNMLRKSGETLLIMRRDSKD